MVGVVVALAVLLLALAAFWRGRPRDARRSCCPPACPCRGAGGRCRCSPCRCGSFRNSTPEREN